MRKLLIVIVLILTACQPSPEMIQTAIAQTVAAYSPTPEPTKIIEPSRTPEPTGTVTITPLPVRPTELEFEPWRIPPMPEMIEIIKDTSKASGQDWIKDWADYMGIEPPMRWEVYRLPDETKSDVVITYYIEALKARGYEYFSRKGYEEISESYILEYNKDGKIVIVIFWEKTEEYYCRVLVMYKNVDS